MTFTHTDIQERLIDFLYGELDGEARAAFDVHVATCDRCRSEVKAFERTRATARAVVRAPLDQPIPAAVRARVMEAAAREASARATTGQAPARPRTASAEPPARPITAPEPRVASRWFAWWRARWTLPMLATVTAMGVLLLVRETIFREARRPLGENPLAELTPKTAPAPSVSRAARLDNRERGGAEAPSTPASASARASAPAPTAEYARGMARDRQNRLADKRAGVGKATNPGQVKSRREPAASASAKGAVHTPEKRSFGSGHAGSVDDLLEGLSDRPLGSSRYSSGSPREEADEGLGTRASSPPPVARQAAQPPPAPPAKPSTPAPPPRAASAAPRAKKTAAASSAEEPSAAFNSIGRGSPAQESEKADSPTPAADDGMPVAREPVAREPVTRKSAAPTGGASATPPDPAAAPFDRAEKLMAAQRWNDAIAAYRDLLQRFPRHASAPTWRRRLAAAQAAAARDDRPFAQPPPSR